MGDESECLTEEIEMTVERIATAPNCSAAPETLVGACQRGSLPQARIPVPGFLLFLLMLLLLPGTVAAQIAPRSDVRVVQAGVAVFPGAGVVVGYVLPRGFYTVGAVAYGDATPSFSGGEGSLLVSFGLGGSIRPLGVYRLLANAEDPGYDLDLGVRVGPSLFFPYGESSRRQNPFSLFIEPFARITSTFGNRTGFVEVGIQRPILRAGLWMTY